jgi:hypothetical protein
VTHAHTQTNVGMGTGTRGRIGYDIKCKGVRGYDNDRIG